MSNYKKATLAAITLAAVIGGLWIARSSSGDAPFENRMMSEDGGILRKAGQRQEEVDSEKRGKEAQEDESLPADAESLGELLPKWLVDEGALLEDRREIDGHVVLRSRGRYEWEDGKSMEVEISDLGSSPDESLIKSLGFDLSLGNSETESGFTQSHVEDGYVINREYDFNDQAGSLQVIVENRYLIEVQIQQLPEAAFQEILDVQIPFDEIFKRLRN